MKKNTDVYKEKYYDLRAKYLTDIDFSWREGFQEGYDVAQQEAQQQAQAEAEQQQAMMEQQDMGGEQGGNVSPEDAAFQAPGQPGTDVAEENQLSADDQAMQANGSGGLTEPLPPMEGELGKNIDELMTLLAKGSKPKLTDLRKVAEKIDSIRKSSQETVVDTKKSNIVKSVFEKWEEEDNVKV